jgi:FkbM family methyltransferase
MSAFDDFIIKNSKNLKHYNYFYHKLIRIHRHCVFSYFKKLQQNKFTDKLLKVLNFLGKNIFFQKFIYEGKISANKKLSPINFFLNNYYEILLENIINYKNGVEPEQLCLLDYFLPNDGIYMDIGANWGFFSLHVALKKEFIGKVYSFEPHPIVYQQFKSHIKDFNLEKKINLSCKPIGSSIKEVDFFYNYNQTEAGTYNNKRQIVGYYKKNMLTETIDNLNLKNLNFLKIDVEGNEEDSLRGGVTTINKFKPFIFMEHTLDRTSEINKNLSLESLKKLKYLGYHAYLPAWRQNNNKYFVGISKYYTMKKLALIPFSIEDRLCFPGDIMNFFFVHDSKLNKL